MNIFYFIKIRQDALKARKTARFIDSIDLHVKCVNIYILIKEEGGNSLLLSLQKLPVTLLYITKEAVTQEPVCTLQNHIETVMLASPQEVANSSTPRTCDAILADLTIDSKKGIPLIERMQSLYPDVPLFLMIDFEHPLHLTKAISLGVTQYFSKDTDAIKIAETISDYFNTQVRDFYKMEISKDGKILSISDSFARLLSYDASRLCHRSLQTVMEPLQAKESFDCFIHSFFQRDTLHALFRKKDGERITMGGNILKEVTREGKHTWVTGWFPLEWLEKTNDRIRAKLQREIYLKSLMKFHAAIGRELFFSQSADIFLQNVIGKLHEIDENMSGFFLENRIDRLENAIYSTIETSDFSSVFENSIDLQNEENERLFMPLFLSAKHQQTVFISNISHLPSSPMKIALSKAGYVTMAAIPMKVGNYRHAEGIMSLLFKKHHRYDKEEFQMWQDIATTIAIGIEGIETRRERDILIEKLDKIAHTDNLTGALNRRRGVEILEYEISRSKRYGNTFSVIFLDMDHFKKINDVHGHGMGDKVLIQAVETIKESIRATDSIIRWGGEEFLIVLPETTLDDAIFFAEKLRAKIEHQKTDIPQPITASFGVAQWQPDMSFDDLIIKSDEKMYEAKRLGRNRIAY